MSAFETPREMEYFTVAEMTAQTGYHESGWALVVARELIDNALDAQPFESAATETQLREEIIAYYIDEAQASILDRIVMPTIDRRFDSLCHEMAGLLGCRVSECVKILAPAVRDLYRAAQEAADQWR